MDVGAGSGYGMKIMKKAGASAVGGIDPNPGRDVDFGRGEDILGYYDWITCMDVIEHVEDDEEHPDRKDKYFLKHLIDHLYNILDATHRLTPSGVTRNVSIKYLRRRLKRFKQRIKGRRRMRERIN